MLLLTTGVFVVGAVQKSPCATVAWVEHHRPTIWSCDSDIVNALAWEQLHGDRLPYLDPCAPAERACDEYPVVTMYVMRGLAWVSHGDDPYASFFWWSMGLLLLAALATCWALERLGARTLMFAASPVLAFAGSVNWDLVPVAMATLGFLAYVRRRHILAGILWGIGAAAKLYPGLLAVPAAAEERRVRDNVGARRLVVATAATWLATNLPFAVLAFDGWVVFFRFSQDRPADYDSLWGVLCHFVACAPTRAINIVSLVLAIAFTAWIWRRVTDRTPEVPRWMLTFPLLAMLLLTGKVWSPQYSLWLLPWFAMTRVRGITFVQYQLAEVAEFLVRFLFFETLSGRSGAPYSILAVVVIIRGLLLLRCVAEWMHDPMPTVSVAARLPTDDVARAGAG